MANHMFAPAAERKGEAEQAAVRRLSVPDYAASAAGPLDHIAAFLVGLLAGTAVLFTFYRIPALSLAGGALCGLVYIFVAQQAGIEKRKKRLRAQFFDLLEAMSVSMRAGNPPLKALESAREDLLLLYAEDSDIVVELDILLGRFRNSIPLAVSFSDLADRSGLEDIASFASVFATIEGKSSRADEIVRETQQIISDKMRIEMEIDTMMTAAKAEVNIMLVMPLVILLVIGYAGAGFMDAIYTTALGRLVATGGLLVFLVSLFLARRFSSVEL